MRRVIPPALAALLPRVLPALAFLSLGAPCARSATEIAGTGFSVDAIVEASAASPAAATDYDGWAEFVLAETGAPNQVNGTGLPADGQLTSKNGTPFQLQPYTGPNTLVDGDTFTLDNPCSYSDLRFLVTGIGNNAGGNNFTATVTFTDTSTAIFQFSVIDWQLNSAYDAFDTATAYVRRTSTESLGLWNRELVFTLSAADRARTVESITFTLLDRLGLSAVSGTPVAPTIDATDRFAWGENIGWTNWRWDTGTPGKGATIGQFFCAGLLWGENVGWIQLGTGAPADGIRYANTDASDFGVNHDGAGNLTGLAWGENIGWIEFEQVSGKPKIDFATGKLSGYAWGENVGWIDLGSNGTHFVRTNIIDEGPDTDGDMIADAWELEQAMNAGLGAVLTHLDKTADSDGDGESDFEEYLADSDPFDIGDSLRVVALGVDEIAEDISLEWTSSPRRLYDLGSSTDLNPFTLEMADLPPDAGATTSIIFNDGPLGPRKFWRVGAKLPLAP